MARSVELHDSVVSFSRVGESELVLDLAPGIVHESEGAPGVSPGRVVKQHVQVRLRSASHFLQRAGSYRISDGAFQIAGVEHRGVLPLPFEASGSVEAWVVLDSGERMVLSASSIAIEAIGAATYLESFPGVAS